MNTSQSSKLGNGALVERRSGTASSGQASLGQTLARTSLLNGVKDG